MWHKIPTKFPMGRKAIVPYYDYRKKITNPFQLTQLQLLAEEKGVSISDLIWRFITDGILKEKNKREEIEELRKHRT